MDFVEKVVLIDGETIDDFVISLKDLIKKHESIDFNVDELIAKKVDMNDQVASIMCSSGTTGLPKGVQITQANLKNIFDGYKEFASLLTAMHGPVRFLNAAPNFHSLGFVWMCMFALYADPVNIFLPRFEEEAFLKAIEVRKKLVSNSSF